MKQELKSYLESINLSKIFNDTVESKYQDLKGFTGIDEFDDIYISEKRTNEGNREVVSLWAFSSTFFCRATFVDNDIRVFNSKSTYIRILTPNWSKELLSPKENSTFSSNIEFISTDQRITLYASGINCTALLRILKKYFIENA